MPETGPKLTTPAKPLRLAPGRPGGPGHRFPGPAEKARDTRGTLIRLWHYLRDQKRGLLAVVLMVVASAALTMTGPYLIGVAIDRYIVPGDFGGLLSLSILLTAIYLLNSLSTWLQYYLMVGVAQETVLELRKDLFSRLQSLPLKFFDSRPRGDLMSRLTNDIDNVSNTLSNSTVQILSSALTIAGTFFMMLWLSPPLTLLSLITLPVMFYSTKRIAGNTYRHFTEQQRYLGELNGLIEETISGQRVVKVFVREARQIQQFAGINQLLKEAGIRAQSYSGLIPPLMNVFNNLGFAIITGVGGWLAVKGLVTVGLIASFLNYSRQFTRPLNDLANQFNLLQSAIAGAERVFEVMDEEPEAEDAPGAPALTGVAGNVALEKVDFSYQKGTPVLRDINLEVKAGQTIALVGPTGAGKTTIANLLMRFYDIDRGRITIDGLDIRQVQRNSLRSKLGIVLQDTYLFAETVRENIRYGRLTASDAEVETAARLANAEQFILRLPEGYNTVIADGGANLSQGQRQLLAIARAILADPAILILDEATSSVDTRTEMHIQEAMRKLMQGRTSFVIAHRLSTIREADLIAVIDNGRIIEQGKHEELLKARGFYYNLYMSQFADRAS